MKDIVNCSILAARARASGIYNAGSGLPRSFNDIIKNLNRVLKMDRKTDYIDNPHQHYQPHTEADLHRDHPRLALQTQVHAGNRH